MKAFITFLVLCLFVTVVEVTAPNPRIQTVSQGEESETDDVDGSAVDIARADDDDDDDFLEEETPAPPPITKKNKQTKTPSSKQNPSATLTKNGAAAKQNAKKKMAAAKKAVSQPAVPTSVQENVPNLQPFNIASLVSSIAKLPSQTAGKVQAKLADLEKDLPVESPIGSLVYGLRFMMMNQNVMQMFDQIFSLFNNRSSPLEFLKRNPVLNAATELAGVGFKTGGSVLKRVAEGTDAVFEPLKDGIENVQEVVEGLPIVGEVTKPIGAGVSTIVDGTHNLIGNAAEATGVEAKRVGEGYQRRGSLGRRGKQRGRVANVDSRDSLVGDTLFSN